MGPLSNIGMGTRGVPEDRMIVWPFRMIHVESEKGHKGCREGTRCTGPGCVAHTGKTKYDHQSGKHQRRLQNRRNRDGG